MRSIIASSTKAMRSAGNQACFLRAISLCRATYQWVLRQQQLNATDEGTPAHKLPAKELAKVDLSQFAQGKCAKWHLVHDAGAAEDDNDGAAALKPYKLAAQSCILEYFHSNDLSEVLAFCAKHTEPGMQHILVKQVHCLTSPLLAVCYACACHVLWHNQIEQHHHHSNMLGLTSSSQRQHMQQQASPVTMSSHELMRQLISGGLQIIQLAMDRRAREREQASLAISALSGSGLDAKQLTYAFEELLLRLEVVIPNPLVTCSCLVSALQVLANSSHWQARPYSSGT